MALSVNGQFLYVQTEGGASVTIFSVEHSGNLAPIGTVSGLPFGAQGIAAK